MQRVFCVEVESSQWFYFKTLDKAVERLNEYEKEVLQVLLLEVDGIKRFQEGTGYWIKKHKFENLKSEANHENRNSIEGDK